MKKISSLLIGLLLLGNVFAQGVSAPFDLSQPTDVKASAPAPVASANKSAQAPAPKRQVKDTKKERDPEAVNAKVAVKDTAPNQVDMPGVMKIDGKDPRALDFSRTRVLEFSNNGNETVYLSSRAINRFQLPFANAKIVAPKDILSIEQSGNNVYISFKDPSTASIYIEAPNATGVTLGLEIIPKAIQAQTVIVQDSNGVSAQQKPVKSDGFTSEIENLLSSAATGIVPAGYSNIKFTDGIVVKNALRIEPKRLLSNTRFDIWLYEVTNPTGQAVMANREDFDADNVQAMSFFPSPAIAPGKSIKAVVLSNKNR